MQDQRKGGMSGGFGNVTGLTRITGSASLKPGAAHAPLSAAIASFGSKLLNAKGRRSQARDDALPRCHRGGTLVPMREGFAVMQARTDLCNGPAVGRGVLTHRSHATGPFFLRQEPACNKRTGPSRTQRDGSSVSSSRASLTAASTRVSAMRFSSPSLAA